MKSYLKTLTVLLLLVSLLCSLCACGAGESTAGTENAAAQETPQASIVYELSGDADRVTREKTLFPFEAGYTVRRLTRSGSVLVAGGTDKNGEIRLALAEYSVSEDGEISVSPFETIVHERTEEFDEAEIYGLIGDEDGFLLLTGETPPQRLNRKTYTMEETNPDFAGHYRLSRYAADGTLLESRTADVLFQSGGTLGGLLLRGEDPVLYGPSGWAFLSESGEVRPTEPEDIQLSTVQLCDAGLLALGYNYSAEANGPCALAIGDDGGYELLEFPEQNLSACQDAGGLLLFNDGTGFFTWDKESGTITRIMGWSGSEGVSALCRLDESVFSCISGEADAITLLWTAKSDRSEENTVRVLIDTEYSSLAVKLSKLNESDLPYFYEYDIADLGKTEVRTRLMAEIAAGGGPDLILFGDGGMRGTLLDTSTAVFEDLYPFIDADETLDRDSFLPGLLPALETQGELHEMWMQTMIITLAARASDISDDYDYSAPALVRLFQENGNYPFMVGESSASMLNYLAGACARQYVDTESGTCHFDDPSFGELLMWCASLPSKTDGISFDPMDCMTNVEQVNLVRLVAAEGAYYHEPFVYIGFPTGDGQGHYYTSGLSCYRAAIPVNSGNKEGAWAFIREQLTVENQLADNKPFMALPVIREAMDRAAHGPTGFFEDIYLTDGQLEQLYALLNSTTRAYTAADKPLVEIITGEAAAYFQGDRSLEETVRLIQSRASLYVGEKYG